MSGTQGKTEGPEASVGTIDVLIQAEGQSKITILKIAPTETVRGLVEAAGRQGVSPAHGRGPAVASLEEAEEPANLDATLREAGFGHRSRVHIHRCRSVDVTVFFNGRTINRQFPPAATIARVTKWAVGKKGFNLEPTDALEHVLQVGGTTQRPDEDEHLGTLVHARGCAASFDLVPKQRVEG